jgi:hypothetical protein
VIQMKQITTENINESTTQQRNSHECAPRLNRHLELAHTVSAYKTFYMWGMVEVVQLLDEMLRQLTHV